MSDILDKLAKDAQQTILSGFYSTKCRRTHDPVSLSQSIKNCDGNALITEIKTASPSMGAIVDKIDLKHVAREMMHNGAACISVLTEPKNFNGDITYLEKVRKAVDIPILMKDFILSPIQLRVAQKNGADAVLLIKTLFDRGYCECSLDEMISYAHHRDLEVLLETHTLEEFNKSMETDADLIAINNRDLRTLEVNLGTTRKILTQAENVCKPVVSASGIKSTIDIANLKNLGVSAYLVGTALMKSGNIGKAVKELVQG
ncbi:MAG: indole-3-glycerol-phosphate synthase [Candidatus Bathyarchaeota archaeon]